MLNLLHAGPGRAPDLRACADARLALWASAHRQSRPNPAVREHAARAVLTFYRTREIRGVSLAPYGVLGADDSIAMPLVDDSGRHVPRLAISPAQEQAASSADAAFERINPRLRGTGNEQARGRFPVRTEFRRRSRSEPVSDALHSGHRQRPPGAVGQAGRPSAVDPASPRQAARRRSWSARDRDVSPVVRALSRRAGGDRPRGRVRGRAPCEVKK